MIELRVVIADDEPIVRDGIRSLLSRERDVVVVGEARNGLEALELIGTTTPDVLFLDIQMPGADGLEVVRLIPAEQRPAIVFVTAHDEYAIRAFEVHAVDYLLKPFDADRFALALQRVRQRITEPRASQLDALLAALRPARGYPDRLLLKHKGSMVVVPVDDIEWIEAADNYVKVHAGAGRYMVRDALKTIEDRLDPRRFARGHRSAIVNLARVKSLEPQSGGEYVVTLQSGMRLTLSRSYRDEFRRRLEGAATPDAPR
jgi:two-component system LytT family response regulator